MNIVTIINFTVSKSNWTECSTIQGVIGRVISKSAEREADLNLREEYDNGINYLTG